MLDGVQEEQINTTFFYIKVEVLVIINGRVRNPQQVAMRPIDMPNQGFLPTNKRFN
jgi:hypothetical protein